MEKKKLSTTYKMLRALGFNYSEEEYGDVSLWRVIKQFFRNIHLKHLEKMLAAENEDALRALIEEEPELVDDEMKTLVDELIEEGKAQNSLTPEVSEKLAMIKRVIS